MKVFKLKGVVQNYAWGGIEFIPKLIGAQITENPQAEYWMGAHEKGSSTIQPNNISLKEYIEQNPAEALGLEVKEKFGRLPFLFKVLDVADMLSIQVHPTKKEAEEGFKNENNKGIPLSAPNRNYKDDNHKPEIMVALSDFWLLHGFKSKTELKHTLETILELSDLIPIFDREGYLGLYKTVMEESVEKTSRRLQPLMERLLPKYEREQLDKRSPEYWAVKAYHTFCPKGNFDKGIYSIFFFNIVRLAEGEGIFQDAGVPHAYMEGQNIELMANSDNVLRGGLTPKHVDVSELLKHIKFNETVPNVLKGEVLMESGERIYKTTIQDFELGKIDLSANQSYAGKSNSLEIALVIEGEIKVICESESLDLSKGEVFAVLAETAYSIQTQNSGKLYKAKCPL